MSCTKKSQPKTTTHNILGSAKAKVLVDGQGISYSIKLNAKILN
jgi:hypothetical protein